MDWHDMKQYQQGQDDRGNVRFSVPLPTDEDGMVGRECPNEDCQPRYFKIAPREEISPDTSSSQIEDEDVEELLFCPYCGSSADTQQFITREQLDWVKSLIERDMVRTFQNIFKKTFDSNRSTKGGMLSVQLSYKPGRLPSVRHYVEKKLKRTIECDECSYKYAVYGVARFCPCCGRGNLHLHLQHSISIIQILLSAKSEIEVQGGKEAGYHLLGNCLEDCVSLFEGFLRVIYSNALRMIVPDTMHSQKISNIRNSFQNLTRAENIIRSDLGWELLDDMSSADREFIEIQFSKRHVITHNLGLVDERFQSQVQTWQRAGQDIEIDSHDVARLLSILEATLQYAITKLYSMKSIR